MTLPICTVSGIVYDGQGQPMPDVVVLFEPNVEAGVVPDEGLVFYKNVFRKTDANGQLPPTDIVASGALGVDVPWRLTIRANGEAESRDFIAPEGPLDWSDIPWLPSLSDPIESWVVFQAAMEAALGSGGGGPHTHEADDITDSSALGRSVLTAPDAATARTALGAGTSSVVVGSGSGEAADAAQTLTALGLKADASAVSTALGTKADAAATTAALAEKADADDVTAGLAGKASTGDLTAGLATKAPLSHTHPASQLSDSTAVGRSVVTAADAPAARAAIGAGTSSLALGSTSSTAAAGDHSHTPASIGAAPTVHTHTAAAISDSSAVGRSVLTAADATAARAAIGAASATGGAVASTDITDSTATGRAVLTAADAAAGRTALGAGTSSLALGTTGSTAAAGNHTHPATGISDSTAVGRSVVTAADAAAARTAIGAGTSSLALGTTGVTAAAGDHTHTAAQVGAAPASHTHPATAISDSTATGRSVLTATDAAAGRTALGAAQAGAAPTAHTHPASEISDSTTTGRAVIVAASAAAARTAIGAGTSDLALGSTGTTAAAGNHTHTAAAVGAAPTVHTHVATDISDSTATGRSVLLAASAAAGRTALSAAAATHTHAVADLADSTTIGRLLMQAADAASARAAINAEVVGAAGGTGDASFVNVREVYGTNTAAVQAAVNAVTSSASKTILYFSPGATPFQVRAVDLSGKSNIVLYGIKGRSIIQYDTATGTVGANDSMLYWNAWAVPGTNDRNITVTGLTLKGTNGAAVVEQQALLHLSAVDDVLVDDCEFFNFQGDAINIARTTMGGSDTGVRNRRVRVSRCYFDGTFVGRNGVTIIAGEMIDVEFCYFYRCAKSSMPGAIDIEPNSFDTSAICRDIRIRFNIFEENGGFEADVHLAFIPAAPTTVFDRITVEGNTFLTTRNASAIDLRWVSHAATTGDPEQNLVVRHNYIGPPSASNTYNKHQAIYLRGVKGVWIESNTIQGWARRAVGMVGGDETTLVRSVRVQRNRFLDVGATTGYIVNLDYCVGLEVYDNETWGATTLSAFVAVMAAYDVDGVRVVRNRLRNVTNALHFGPTAQPAQTGPTGNVSQQNETIAGSQVNVAGYATGTIPGVGGSASVASTDITDSTTVGRAVLVAVDAAAARTAIGAGTSSLALGTTSSTAAAGDHTHTAAAVGAAPTSHTHTASQLSDSTATGRAVIVAADAAAARTAIGAGTSSVTVSGSGSGAAAPATHTHPATDISDSTATGRSVVTAASAAAARTAIGAGTSDLALGATGTTAAAGNHTHAATGISDSTAVGRSILTAADAAAVRTASGAGRVDSTDGTILNVIKITQAAYTALGTKVATTLYVIVG